MRLLLTTAPYDRSLSYYHRFPRFPVLNLPALAAAVRDLCEVRIETQLACRRPPHRLDEAMDVFGPDVVGVSAPSAVGGEAVLSQYPAVIARHRGVRFVAGGMHAASAFRRYLDAGFEAVVLGEGEEPLRAVLESFAGGRPIGAVPGVAWRSRRGRVTANPPEKCLDPARIPEPAWELVPAGNDAIYGLSPHAAAVETTRGCPYACRFCTVPGFWGRYRERPLGHVLCELDALSRRGVGEVLFVDHSFGLNRERADDLASALIDRGRPFAFGAFMRPDTVAGNPETIRRLADAGLAYAILGFESHSAAELSWMEKGFGPETNSAAARVLRDCGVVVWGSHMYFTPAGGVADALTTCLRGMRECDVFRAGAFAALPGAPAGNGSGVPGVEAYDCAHVAAAGRPRRIAQAATLALFACSVLSPGQWAGMFSGSATLNKIQRTEYRALIERIMVQLTGAGRGS